MNRAEACNYLRSSGFSDEQIKAIEGAFTCEDAISRQAVLDAIITLWADKPFGNPALTEIKECVERVPPVNPQKPKSECEHDYEILKAYSDGASTVLDKVRASIDGLLNDEDNSLYEHGVMDCLEIIDKYAEEGKA